MLGHALDMKAIHGGKAKNERLEAHTIAVLLRGGMIPQASVYPAEMRATRDLLRRRRHLRRHRAGLLAHRHQTNRQYHLPPIGKTLAYQANRGGVAERLSAPAVQQSLEVDLTLIGSYDRLLTALELAIVNTAKAHDAQTFDRLRSLPGLGNILALVLRYAIPDLHRFPRGQEGVSYSRLVQCAKAAAGQRYGTAGAKIGNADLTWAVSEAAVRLLRHNPAGPKYLARLAKQQGKGQALTGLAHQLARAVYDRLSRETAFALDNFFSAYGSGTRAPDASLDAEGISLRNGLWQG